MPLASARMSKAPDRRGSGQIRDPTLDHFSRCRLPGLYNAQVTWMPFDRLNVSLVQNAAALRYQI